MKKIFHKITVFVNGFCSVVFYYCHLLLTCTIVEEYFSRHRDLSTKLKDLRNGNASAIKPSARGCAITKKNCCSDQQFAVEGQDELQLSFDTSVSIEQQQFARLI